MPAFSSYTAVANGPSALEAIRGAPLQMAIRCRSGPQISNVDACTSFKTCAVVVSCVKKMLKPPRNSSNHPDVWAVMSLMTATAEMSTGGSLLGLSHVALLLIRDTRCICNLFCCHQCATTAPRSIYTRRFVDSNVLTTLPEGLFQGLEELYAL